MMRNVRVAVWLNLENDVKYDFVQYCITECVEIFICGVVVNSADFVKLFLVCCFFSENPFEFLSVLSLSSCPLLTIHTNVPCSLVCLQL